MKQLHTIIYSFCVTLCLSGCKVRSPSATEKDVTMDQKKDSLVAYLQAAGWDEEKIKQKILEYERAHNKGSSKSQGIWILGPKDIDSTSEIKTDVIRSVLDRKQKANRAIAASVGLTVVGVALSFAPIPGSQGVGLLLIKDGMALGVVYLSLSAETQFREGRAMEVKDLTHWEPVVKSALNDMIQSSVAKNQVGSVTKVSFSSSRFIEFYTSEGFHFVTKDVVSSNDALFVTRSKNWSSSLPNENDTVLSLIDGSLIKTAVYIELDAHMKAATSKDYQKTLHDALEQWTTGQTVSTPSNVVSKWNLDQEIAGASAALQRIQVQTGILAGRAYQNKNSEMWERSQAHLRSLESQVTTMVQKAPRGNLKSEKLRYLIEIYELLGSILKERADYLAGNVSSPQ